MKGNLFYASPVQGFVIYKQDETAEDFNYYLFQNIYGDYFILRENKSTKEIGYSFGLLTAMANAWTNKVTQTYSSPAEAFISLR